MKTTIARAGLAALTTLLCLTPAAQAGRVVLLSTTATESGTAEGGAGGTRAVSADGRWIAFASAATNLVTGQEEPGTYPYEDVFLHDRLTGATVLVSHAAGSATRAANYISNRPSISADGRWVVYLSRSGSIIPGQNPDPFEQVFLYDRDSGTNTLVSHSTAGLQVESTGTALDARVSADGSWVVFTSTGNDLVSGLSLSPASSSNVFAYQRATGQILLVSRAAGTILTGANGPSDTPLPSADGRFIVFQSQATNLISGYSGTGRNVFLFDRLTGVKTLVSRTASSAVTGAGGHGAVISANGSAVAFLSAAGNVVSGQADTNGRDDAFLFNRSTGTNVLASRAAAGPATAGNGGVSGQYPLQISDDGTYVAFAGDSSDAIAGQADQAGSTDDIFVFERTASSLTLVSRSSASATATGNRRSGSPAMSADGRWIAFHSAATDLVAGQVDPVFEDDVFLFDQSTGTTTLVSGVGGSAQIAANRFTWFPQISADGSVVSYQTRAKNVVAGVADLNSATDIVLYDRAAGTSSFASRQGPDMASATAGVFSMVTSASADGRYAVLLSWAENLAPGQVDDNQSADVFLVDRGAGTTTLVSRSAASPTAAANGASGNAAISADGNWIVLNSLATDLVPGQVDTPGTPDVFLYERATGTVTLVSHAAGSAATAGNAPCGSWDAFDGYFPGGFAISADGRYVAFECRAGNLVAGQSDGNGSDDIFLYDRTTGQASLASHIPGAAATAGNGGSHGPRLSADGRWIAFTSVATDLITGTDGNGTLDVFLHDRDTGVTLLASRAAGTVATTADGPSDQATLSADGRHLVFASQATNLVPGQTDTPLSQDVFLFDRATGTVELISRAAGSATAAANGTSEAPAVSADGLLVAFTSLATNLVPGQTGPAGGVFVHDRSTRRTELISHSGFSPTATLGIYAPPAMSADGRHVAFVFDALYIADRQLGTLERVAPAAVFYGEDVPVVQPIFSAGGTVFFNSVDPVLAPADYNGGSDAFAWIPEPPAASDFYTVAPCRLLNTQVSGPAPVSGQTSILDVHGACGVPVTATAVAVNVTVLQPAGPGRVSAHRGNVLAPGTSTINFAANQTLANNAIVPLATNGEGTLALTPFLVGGGAVHVIVDVSGYFEEETR